MFGFKVQAKTTTIDKGAQRILRQIESVGNGVSITTGIHFAEGTALPKWRGKVDGDVPVAHYANWQEYGNKKIPARPTFRPTVTKNQVKFTRQTAMGMRQIYAGGMSVRKLMTKQGRRTKDWLKTRIMLLTTPPNSAMTIRQKVKERRGTNPLIYSGTMYKSIKSKVNYPAGVKNRKLRLALGGLEKALKGVRPS